VEPSAVATNCATAGGPLIDRSGRRVVPWGRVNRNFEARKVNPMSRLLVAVLLVGMAADRAAAQAVFDNGGVNTISSFAESIPFLSQSISVQNSVGGNPTTLAVSGDALLPSPVSIFDSSALSISGTSPSPSVFVVTAHDSSTVNMSGGNVQSLAAMNSSTVVVSGGQIVPTASVHNSASLTLSGGQIQDIVADSGTVNIDGGTVTVQAFLKGTADGNVTGGQINGTLAARENSTLSVTGGDINVLELSGQAVGELRGGIVDSLVLSDMAMLTIFGTDFGFGPGLTYDALTGLVHGTGLLTGMLEDDSPLNLLVDKNDSTAKLILNDNGPGDPPTTAPEAGSVLIWLIAGAGLIGHGHWRRRRRSNLRRG